MFGINNNLNRDKILEINQTIKKIAIKVFESGEEPSSEVLKRASAAVQALTKKREKLYYDGFRPGGVAHGN